MSAARQSPELLLARISAAAGRAGIGRRLATYPGISRRSLHWWRRSDPEARLDLYERGLTVALRRRVHVVRYDTTALVQTPTAYTLTDITGEPVVLRVVPAGIRSSGEFRDAEMWGPAIQRAVRAAR